MPLSQIVSDSIENGAVAPVDLSSVAQYTGFKNRVINGAMAIDQRNNGAAATVTTSTAGTYTPDRFYSYTGTGSLWQTQRVATGNLDFPYANRVQRIAAQTSTSPIYWRQIIETVNCSDLAGQTVTFSFYATAGANYSGGAITAQVYTGTGSDQGATSLNTGAWTGFSIPISQTFTPTTTRTRFSFTGTLSASALEVAVALFWTPTGTAGAADFVDITGVQIEKGVTATSFDYRPFGTELVLCQRYYETTDVLYTVASWTTAANQAVWKVTKRVLPTIVNIPGFGSGGVYSPFQYGVAAVYQSSNNSVASGGTITGSAEL